MNGLSFKDYLKRVREKEKGVGMNKIPEEFIWYFFVCSCTLKEHEIEEQERLERRRR